jgi:hypothetical protein
MDNGHHHGLGGAFEENEAVESLSNFIRTEQESFCSKPLMQNEPQ